MSRQTGTTWATIHARIEAAIEDTGIAVVARDSTGRLRVGRGSCIECGEELANRYAVRCREHAKAEVDGRRKRKRRRR